MQVEYIEYVSFRNAYPILIHYVLYEWLVKYSLTYINGQGPGAKWTNKIAARACEGIQRDVPSSRHDNEVLSGPLPPLQAVLLWPMVMAVFLTGVAGFWWHLSLSTQILSMATALEKYAFVSYCFASPRLDRRHSLLICLSRDWDRQLNSRTSK